MTAREQVEQQIRDALATETSALALSDRLFHPNGLFNQLATTEAERRAIAQTPLFQQAQRRLSELQKAEAIEFARVASQAQGPSTEGAYVLKLRRPAGWFPTAR